MPKRKIRRFMLLVANSRWFGKRYWLWFTPAICYLAPILKKYGLEVEIVEANIDNLTADQVRDRIRKFAPDVVGITNMSLEYWRQAHFCAALAKEVSRDITVVMGGVHPTTMPEKVMGDENIDHVILSEGEDRLVSFLDILESDKPDFSKMNGVGYRENGEVRIIKPEGLIMDLDALPLPDYNLFDWRKVMNNEQKSVVGFGTRRNPVGIVMTSRGCRYKCCFCAGWLASGRKVRLRSAENVLKEIDLLVQEYGAKEIIFTDDEMYADRDRCVRIFEGLIERNHDIIWKNMNLAAWRMDHELMKLMKRSGCYQVTISPESGSDRVLRKIIHKVGKAEQSRNVVKWCKELDIEIEADFVIGFPGETWDEIRESTNFAEELDADAIKIAIATPFPGTELFDKAVAGGYLPADFDFYRDDMLGFAHGIINTEEFTVTELEMLRCLEWDRINFKTEEKKKRYAKMNLITLDELEDFRRQTRRHLGVYFMDQIKDERGPTEEPKLRACRSS
ncbi:B12-binding domain-containing radical SAM protein [Elusimicrobiota bacterium]